MEKEAPRKQYIVFDIRKYTQEQEKTKGHPANAVLGIIRADDDAAAQDTASAIFRDKTVFVRDYDTASKEFVAAAKARGYLNKSEAHPYL